MTHLFNTHITYIFVYYSMKKSLVIFLSFFYLILASGFIQYTHLCKEMTSKVYSFTNTQNQNQDKPCPICSKKDKDLKDKKKDCCQHEVKFVKVDDSVKKQSNFDFSVKFLGDTIPNKTLGTVFDAETILSNTPKNTAYSSSKVSIQSNPIYILHCVYRI